MYSLKTIAKEMFVERRILAGLYAVKHVVTSLRSLEIDDPHIAETHKILSPDFLSTLPQNPCWAFLDIDQKFNENMDGIKKINHLSPTQKSELDKIISKWEELKKNYFTVWEKGTPGNRTGQWQWGFDSNIEYVKGAIKEIPFSDKNLKFNSSVHDILEKTDLENREVEIGRQ